MVNGSLQKNFSKTKARAVQVILLSSLEVLSYKCHSLVLLVVRVTLFDLTSPTNIFVKLQSTSRFIYYSRPRSNEIDPLSISGTIVTLTPSLHQYALLLFRLDRSKQTQGLWWRHSLKCGFTRNGNTPTKSNQILNNIEQAISCLNQRAR